MPAERTTELGLPMVGLTEARVVDSQLRRVARRTADAAEPMPGRISRSHARMAAAIEPPLDPFSIVLQGRH